MNLPGPDGPFSLDELVAEHRRLDERLRALADQRSLTAAEQVEYALLKKQKLRAKDQIARLQAAERRA